jgi:hypothetical protein
VRWDQTIVLEGWIQSTVRWPLIPLVRIGESLLSFKNGVYLNLANTLLEEDGGCDLEQ